MTTPDRPTDLAKFHFSEAKKVAERAGYQRSVIPATGENHQRADMDLARAVSEIAWGLYRLSEGLRATYILLEEVKGLQQR